MYFGGKGLYHLFVLLLLLTPSLWANAVLSLGNPNCTLAMAAVIPNLDCGANMLVAQLPEQANGIAGVAYGLTGTLTDTSLGTNNPFNTVLTMSTSGVPSGSGVIAPVPVIMEWNFTLALGIIEGHTRINSWTLTFDLQDTSAGNVSLFASLPTITSGPLSITNTTPVTFTGGQTFNLTSPINPANGHTLQQITVLTVNWTGQNNNQDNLMIQLAAHGFDFNEAPEPATFAAGAIALAVALAWRRTAI